MMIEESKGLVVPCRSAGGEKRKEKTNFVLFAFSFFGHIYITIGERQFFRYNLYGNITCIDMASLKESEKSGENQKELEKKEEEEGCVRERECHRERERRERRERPP